METNRWPLDSDTGTTDCSKADWSTIMVDQSALLQSVVPVSESKGQRLVSIMS